MELADALESSSAPRVEPESSKIERRGVVHRMMTLISSGTRTAQQSLLKTTKEREAERARRKGRPSELE